MSKKKVEKELEVKKIEKVLDKGEEALKKTIAVLKEIKQEKKFTNIKKLKCNYTTYKEQRTQHNMPVETNCSKCGKRFEAGEEIYTAFEEGKQGSQIICGNCAKRK